MNPARRRANRFSHVLKKSDDVMVRSPFDFQDFRNRKSRSLPDFRSVFFWDLAQLGHRLAGEHFDLQPNLELASVRPDFAHLWPGITVNHANKIKATRMRGKPFCFSNGAAKAAQQSPHSEKQA